MLWLTEDARLYCKHGQGLVTNLPSNQFVTIAGRRVLVEADPVGRPIKHCMALVPFKPCTTTLPVQKGYSEFLRIGGKRVCLDTVIGFTDGTPPGVARYDVRTAGQQFVSSEI